MGTCCEEHRACSQSHAGGGYQLLHRQELDIYIATFYAFRILATYRHAFENMHPYYRKWVYCFSVSFFMCIKSW